MPDIKTALLNAIDKWDDEPALNKEKVMQQVTATPITPITVSPPAPVPVSETPHQYFKPTTNITRTTFEFVRDNPGKNCAEVEQFIESKGMNHRSVSSLLSQMVQQGMMLRRGEHGAATYYAAVTEYTPIKARATRLKMAAKRAAAEKRQAKKGAAGTGIAALNPAPTSAIPQPEQAAPRAAFTLMRNETATQMISKLSVLQAREMYDELKKIFGG